MMNHLEQLVSEWLEYNEYFVRKNVLVGKLSAGGYESELDVVAFNNQTNHLVHVEPSLDANSWKRRGERFGKKFGLGREHIPRLFKGIKIPENIDQICILLFASKANHKSVGGGRIMAVSDLYREITEGLRGKKVARQAVHEQYPLLRTIQYCLEYESTLFQPSAADYPPSEFRIIKN